MPDSYFLGVRWVAGYMRKNLEKVFRPLCTKPETAWATLVVSPSRSQSGEMCRQNHLTIAKYTFFTRKQAGRFKGYTTPLIHGMQYRTIEIFFFMLAKYRAGQIREQRNYEVAEETKASSSYRAIRTKPSSGYSTTKHLEESNREIRSSHTSRSSKLKIRSVT